MPGSPSSSAQAAPAERLGMIPSLDGLRAIAILVVMAFHASIPGFFGGRAGVDMFFVLSGFLITTLLLQEHAREGVIRLRAFYMRRILRLYPALIAALLGAIVLAALKVPIFHAGHGSLENTLRGAPFVLLYTMNIARAAGWTGGGFIGHTWSLAIEEQFYLVWPIVVIAVMRRGNRRVLLGWLALGCAITSAALRAGLEHEGIDGELLYNATFSHVDGIFLGCAVGVLWCVRPDVVGRIARPLVVAVAVIVCAVIIVSGQSMNTYGYLLIVVATAVILGHLLHDRSSRLSKALSHRAAVAIGKRSYGLYLYHWPIFLFIGIDTRPIILIAGFSLSFAAAWVSYAYIEQPFLRMKRHWASSERST